MPIVPGDLLFKYSTTAGAAGNANTGTANGSLGKYVSTTQVASGTNGIFDDITGDENAASTVDYRGIFVQNNNSTITLTASVVWVSAEVAGGASVAIATDNISASAAGSSSAQMAQIANETTAPSGTSAFSTPTTKAGGLSTGSLTAGQVKGVWVRRTAANTAAVDADGFTLSFAGDTTNA